MEREIEAYRGLDSIDLDKLRRGSNPIWMQIQTHINDCFGILAEIVFGKLQNDKYLLEHYVNNFNIDEDREKLLTFTKKLIKSQDRDFITFMPKHRYSIKGKFVTSFELMKDNITNLIIHEKPKLILLLGNRSSGKTSLISYLLKSIPQDIILFTDNLAHCTTKGEITQDMHMTLANQIHDYVYDAGKRKGMKTGDITNKLFYEEFESSDAIIEGNETELEKKLKIEMRYKIIEKIQHQKKLHSRDSLPYLRAGIRFLKSMDKTICMIFDDADRIKKNEVATVARAEAHYFRETLNVPIIMALREITVRKGKNNYGESIRYHICPPRFEDIVSCRFDTFQKILKDKPPASIVILDKKISTDEYISFVKNIMKSITKDNRNLLLFYLLSNSNIGLMLDYFKCLLASSHFTHNYMMDIISGKLMSQHKIIETLMLYVYERINPENTFILNLYNSGYPELVRNGNSLFMIRILQCIKEKGKRIEGRKGINFKKLEDHMCLLGYKEMVKNRLEDIIRLFEDYSLIDTSIFGYDHKKKNAEIYLCDAAYYHINYLIFSYRYLQTIIPDAWLDYEIDLTNFDLGLQIIDKEIEKFISFIYRCEKEEDKFVQDRQLLELLNQDGKISDRIRNQYLVEKSRQMGSGTSE